MPRHDKSATPRAKRRAPKGSIIGQKAVKVDADTMAALGYLQLQWGLGEHETWRRALKRQARAEGLDVPEATESVP
ncbi:MAG: hypothetical protein JXB05_37785 [Myxococcaceae bacterium]|nr:hypothetical protein [Myxococcaceae bacterium]